MLLGGRISRIRPAGREVGTPAAQIVYQVSGHKMSVLVFRDEDSELTEAASEHTLVVAVRVTDSSHRVAIIRRGGHLCGHVNFAKG